MGKSARDSGLGWALMMAVAHGPCRSRERTCAMICPVVDVCVMGWAGKGEETAAGRCGHGPAAGSENWRRTARVESSEKRKELAGGISDGCGQCEGRVIGERSTWSVAGRDRWKRKRERMIMGILGNGLHEGRSKGSYWRMDC